MGYTTEFQGYFELDRPLKKKHAKYLYKFSDTRRMKRDVNLLPDDPLRKKVGLPAGKQGEYFVAGKGMCGQDRDPSITNYNYPPSPQPGLWCQWTVGDECGESLTWKQACEKGSAVTICWDQGEKFYEYVAWLEYIINNFIGPWGYILNGEVQWREEDWDDNGTIQVVNNKVVISE